MCRYGFRGTFYLNDLELIPPEGIAPEVFLGELLSGGCAAGAHGVRHASLAELTDSDEIFRELGVCRAMLEAACSAPVTAHAFAYRAYRRAGDPGAGRRIADCFTRCGFLHESYGNFPAPERGLRSSNFSGEHWILPGDCDTSFSLFRQRLEERLADSRALEINPNLTVGLHSRQNGDGWREMEQCYSAYAFRPDWWYCTAGDYGAYRYEYHHAEIRRLSVSGREAVWRVRRLPPAELGGEVPLYLHCGNAVSAEADTARSRLPVSRRRNGTPACRRQETSPVDFHNFQPGQSERFFRKNPDGWFVCGPVLRTAGESPAAESAQPYRRGAAESRPFRPFVSGLPDRCASPESGGSAAGGNCRQDRTSRRKNSFRRPAVLLVRTGFFRRRNSRADSRPLQCLKKRRLFFGSAAV